MAQSHEENQVLTQLLNHYISIPFYSILQKQKTQNQKQPFSITLIGNESLVRQQEHSVHLFEAFASLSLSANVS